MKIPEIIAKGYGPSLPPEGNGALVPSFERFTEALGLYLRDSGIQTAPITPQKTLDLCRVLSADTFFIVIMPAGLTQQLSQANEPWGNRPERTVIPIVLEANSLQVGPLLVPGGDCCWRCWDRRTRQHSMAVAPARIGFEIESNSQPDENPLFLEPAALLAASWASELASLLSLGKVGGGYSRRINLLTRQITESTVLGVHGCPYCGLHRPEATRSHAEIRSALAYLWEPPSDR